MSEYPETAPMPDEDHPPIDCGRSSVYSVLTPEVRQQVRLAIVDHDPPTYRGIYEKFKLADTGLSFQAFYRYARNLRDRVETLQHAELALPGETEVARALPLLIGRKLVDALLDQEATAGAVCRLAEAYRRAVSGGQHAAALAGANRCLKGKSADDLRRMVQSFINVARNAKGADQPPP